MKNLNVIINDDIMQKIKSYKKITRLPIVWIVETALKDFFNNDETLDDYYKKIGGNE